MSCFETVFADKLVTDGTQLVNIYLVVTQHVKLIKSQQMK